MVNEPGKTADRGNETGITRRRFILGTIVVAVIGAFGSLLSMLKLLSPSKKGSGYMSTIAPGDVLVYAAGSNIGTEIKASSLNVGDAELVYPKGKSSNPANLVQLIKLNEVDFKKPTDRKLTDKGFLAYSAICTHLGCTVSWVKNPASPDLSYTECFCHNSIFNPARGEIVEGGPAPIPLAQIGVRVNENDTIVFTGTFTGPIGPQV